MYVLILKSTSNPHINLINRYLIVIVRSPMEPSNDLIMFLKDQEFPRKMY